MINLLILVVCLIIGICLRLVKAVPENAATTLGQLVLFVPLPAMSLLSIPDLEWSFSLIPLGLATWIIFFTAYFFFTYLGRKLNWDKSLVGCLILTAGFCNSAFVGFPVIETMFGMEALKYAIFLDQSGSFLIVSTFGIWIALNFSSGNIRKRIILKKVLLFPPFIAFVVGLLCSFWGIRPEGAVREILEKLSLLLTPMALICVGLQLRWSGIKQEFNYLTLGLFFKLILAPLIIFSLYFPFHIHAQVYSVTIIESAMAPMITSSILASTYNLRPVLAGMMVGLGVPLSFLTLIIWYVVII